MGILGLAKLIGDLAPAAVKDNEIKNYFGRKIAIDASMSIYQFLIAVRQEGNVLTDSSGETTSHLLGLFYRTIRMMENGIKPVYVFDGKPPEMKAGELNKRQERREEAKKELEKAEEDGNAENINKFSRRLVKVTRQHNDECKRLLTLMGVPYIEAPGEAEAQCAAMVKTGKVFALATEDMDGLTFGANVLLRHLTFSEARKMPIQEFHHDRILSELQFSESQFIDLCILLGCDYCDSIRGIGPKRAVELIRQHKSLEGVLKHIDKSKYTVPDDWPYEEVRRLFKEPDILTPEKVELKWTEPNEEKLVKFLCEEKSFGEDRVRNGVKKMLKSRSSQTQGRLDNFFKITPAPGGTKRKAETVDDKKKSKKKPGRKPK